jgi:MOSC domain-containing protein YiiM
MGRLLGIAVRDEAGGPMRTLDSTSVSCESGVEPDVHGAPGPRQVSVLAQESWADACREVDAELPWTTRRANLLIEGVPLASTTGRRLRVGPAVLEITDESAPCENMDEQHSGLRQVLMPDGRGGVVCRVVEGGSVGVGDAVSLE